MNFRSVSGITIALFSAVLVSACKTGSGGSASGVRVSISSPTTLPTINTTDTTMSLSGSAASEAGISQVTWMNDRGGRGVASGTESWKITGIVLKYGNNDITVTAKDNTGVRSSENISIYRESGEPGAATLFWNAPISRANGDPLTNLSGYKIFYGRISGIYDYQITITNPGIVAYVVENLMPGDWYFAMTAYDSQGMESVLSNEIVRNVI